MIDPEVRDLWRLTGARRVARQHTTTWLATRDGTSFVVKHQGATALPDWRYELRVMAALRTQGWPTPELAEEPLQRPDGVWLLLHRLPGRPTRTGGADSPAEQRERGRLLAKFHEAAAATGITDRRAGFPTVDQVVNDPELHRWLRTHEVANPQEGRLLRTHLDATAAWFAGHPAPQARRSVIHGDFAPWNLLYDGGRLSGVLDFETSHHTFQVADFALSWRGYQDEVIRGYQQVRPLSEDEWELIRPAYHAWIFLGVKDTIAAHYGQGPGPAPLRLDWQVAHLRKRSTLWPAAD